MSTEATELCPTCSNGGRKLEPVTIRALLRDEYLGELDNAEGFRFCGALDCDVVWYRAVDGRTFQERHLSVAVGRKSTSPARPVCYCFGHTALGIERDGEAIEASIRAACKAGLDRCEETNPEGRCCLGEVRRVMKAASPELEQPVVPAQPDCCAPAAGPVARTATGTTRNLTAVGAVAAAILSSACCWLPLAALGLGVSAVGVAGFLEVWRWPLVGLSSVLLAGAFYLVYRPHPACEDGVCEPAPRRAGFTKAVLWLAAVFVAAFALLPEYIGPLLSEDAAAKPARASSLTAPPAAQMVRTLRIEGMTCEGCATHLHTALSEVPGVTRVEVSYPKKTARLWVTPGARVKAPIRKAVESLGYRIAGES